MKFFTCEHCIHGLDALYDVSTPIVSKDSAEQYLYSVEEDLSDVFKLASNKTGYIVKEINAWDALNLMSSYIKN